MIEYKVQGSWDGSDWWDNATTDNLDKAIKIAESYIRTRSFKHRRIVTENIVVWSYIPK